MGDRANGVDEIEGAVFAETNGESEEGRVGLHVREARRRRGMSLTELSRQVGVSKSMISQIEHGTANASVPVLRAIARALEVPLFTFFVDDDVRDALVRREDRRQLHIPGSQVTRELLVPDIHRRVVMLIAYLPPRSSSGRESSTHQGEECFVVTRGSVQLDLNGRTIDLNEGDSYYLDSNVPHLFRNDTDEPAEIIVAITAR